MSFYRFTSEKNSKQIEIFGFFNFFPKNYFWTTCSKSLKKATHLLKIQFFVIFRKNRNFRKFQKSQNFDFFMFWGRRVGRSPFNHMVTLYIVLRPRSPRETSATFGAPRANFRYYTKTDPNSFSASAQDKRSLSGRLLGPNLCVVYIMCGSWPQGSCPLLLSKTRSGDA